MYCGNKLTRPASFRILKMGTRICCQTSAEKTTTPPKGSLLKNHYNKTQLNIVPQEGYQIQQFNFLTQHLLVINNTLYYKGFLQYLVNRQFVNHQKLHKKRCLNVAVKWQSERVETYRHSCTFQWWKENVCR